MESLSLFSTLNNRAFCEKVEFYMSPHLMSVNVLPTETSPNPKKSKSRFAGMIPSTINAGKLIPKRISPTEITMQNLGCENFRKLFRI
jgi:hypothetical protein